MKSSIVRASLVALVALSGARHLAAQAAAPTPPPASAPAVPAVLPTPPANDRVTISPFTDKPETFEERMTRFGINEDPGPDPDPKKKFIRFGNPVVIEKYPAKTAAFDRRKGYVRPLAYVNIPREIYQQNDEFVWVWMPLVDPSAPAQLSSQQIEKRKWSEAELKWVRQVVPEFTELRPPMSSKTLTFHESSEGLPTTGSWRNSLAVADMNEDGRMDLVVPPPRGSANGVPLIYLAQADGKWKLWDDPSFPKPTNYGSIAAADLNGDKHVDLVMGIHLLGVQAVVGNGKGYFEDASKGLAATDYPTRRAIVADFNKDGKPDIATISEGPALSDRDNQHPVLKPRIRVFLNDGKANWTEQKVADPLRELGGDWLTAGDFDGNGWTDLAGSSNVYGGNDTIWLNDGKKWTPFGRGWLPFYSYYNAVTSGHFTSKKKDDLVTAFNRYFIDLPNSGITPPKNKEIAGIDRISWGKSGPLRTPIIRWASGVGIWGMGSGDFDGDGNLDIAFAKGDPREFVFLLGDGKGGFSVTRASGIDAQSNTIYDLKVTDVNGDGRPDVIAMYEKGEQNQEGSIHVFLNDSGKKGGK